MDAVIQHLEFHGGYDEKRSSREWNEIDKLHNVTKGIRFSNEQDWLEISNQIDSQFAHSMWLNMRPLNILLNNEPTALTNIPKYADGPGQSKLFASSSLDLSVCWSRRCSIWSSYFNKLDIDIQKKEGVPPHCICAFISNCDNHDARQRMQVVSEISKIVQVHQYGSCGRNAREDPRGKVFELAQSCKFYLAFENSRFEDYVTEKFYQGFESLKLGGKTITVYRGALNINEFGFPKLSFINIDDFLSPTDLALYLKDVCQHDDKFMKLFQEFSKDENVKQISKTFDSLHSNNVHYTPCRICTAIAETKLSRYLLFKIGLRPTKFKVDRDTWKQFKKSKGLYQLLSRMEMTTLDDVYDRAYGRFFSARSELTNWNNYKYNHE